MKNGIMQENFEDLVSPNLWRALAAETFGTLFIVLLGCGSWLNWTDPHNPTVVQISLTFGFAVGTMVWAFFHISGGHFNPAVTAATLVTRRVSIVRGVLYMIAQCLGGILGAGILYGLTPSGIRGTLGSTVVKNGVTAPQGFGVELIITFVLVIAVFASNDGVRKDLRGSAPLTIGLAVAVCHLFAIPFTSSGLNPARSFGPAVIVGGWTDHWIYWVGPIVGGVIAGLLYEYVFSAGATVAQAKKCLLRHKQSYTPAQTEVDPIIEAEEGAKTELVEMNDTQNTQNSIEEKDEKIEEKVKLTEENEKE
ncbi:aquaporin AQPAe.a-like [Haliotis rubra]|uniref:aquaporin AQPAe.a-like n=1 Tax=Haliotis rubra TaxID=36100 RepID=UPI001EE603EF|nr:aquaporin AQPAe.a-like [Haliotis rubra]